MKQMPHSSGNRVRVKVAARRPGVPAVIYPDHGARLESAARVIRSDCNGVTVDVSHLPFGGNLHPPALLQVGLSELGRR